MLPSELARSSPRSGGTSNNNIEFWQYIFWMHKWFDPGRQDRKRTRHKPEAFSRKRRSPSPALSPEERETDFRRDICLTSR